MSHAYQLATVLAATMSLLPLLYAQGNAAGLIAAQTSSESQKPVPVTMTECEGVNNCATWTFLGAQGNGKWPTGEDANLSVERYDTNSVVIRRADSTGTSAGLTAVYTGTRHGDRVGGDFTSSWPGHWDNKAGNWYATVEAPVTLPSVFHVCSGDHCFTYTLESGKFTNYTNLPYQSGEKRILTIRSFTRASVVFDEVDYGTFPLTATWTGQVSPQNSNVVEGIGRITSWAGKPTHNPAGTPFKLAFGASLDTVAGSDGERSGPRPQQSNPTIVIAPVVCVPWFFTVVCAQ
jgi:hypothetical protein